MSRVDPALIKDWNTLAAALNPTPYINAAGEIEPLGAEGPKGKTYVVWVGRAVGLFNNWCAPIFLRHYNTLNSLTGG